MSSGSISSYPICTSKSVCTPRRRAEAGSIVKTATRLGKSCLRPLAAWPDSVFVCQPYSLCMSKTRFVATPRWRMPASRMRVRKLLPVPLLPKTPLERSTNFLRSRQTRVSSMSSGLPM